MKLLGNSYVLGLLMIVTEAIVNLLVGSILVSGVILSFAVGQVYSWSHKAKMPRAEKIKALLVYLGVIVTLALFFFAYMNDTRLAVLIVAVLAVVQGLFMYLGMSVGSHFFMKAYDRKQGALAIPSREGTPPLSG
ncbi:MAG: hypothetical protein V4682_02350 [Patescibacteria group bacterium]